MNSSSKIAIIAVIAVIVIIGLYFAFVHSTATSKLANTTSSISGSTTYATTSTAVTSISSTISGLTSYTTTAVVSTTINSTSFAGECTPSNAYYSCRNLTLSDATMHAGVAQRNEPAMKNVTIYAIPASAKFNLANVSSYPKSGLISSLPSGEYVNVTISGGSLAYRLPTQGGYIGSLWIVHDGQASSKFATVYLNSQ